jgi:hypothetical protein
MSHIITVAWLIIALFGSVVSVDAAGENSLLHEWGQHSDEELYEGAITVKAPDGTQKVAMLLGGPLGKESVSGVEVGLYVLQADNPARLKPGAKGPTHIFNVTFMDEGSNQLIKEASGAVIIESANGESQRVPIGLVASHYQVSVRLEERGKYQISVAFVAQGHRGRTQGMTYDYIGKLDSPNAR